MNRLAYDPAFPVTAAWSLEFAPVNISVAFFQLHGNEVACIGSRSWYFDGLAECLAEARTDFPWRVAEHVIPPERPKERVWQALFLDQRIYSVTHAPDFPPNRCMLITQRLMSRMSIDTATRPWAPDGNNAQLVDSLNGYRVKELPSHPDEFTMNIEPTHEQYLARAVEVFAAWEWFYGAAPWGAPIDYSKSDEAVI
jgi:hypothetical protein